MISYSSSAYLCSFPSNLRSCRLDVCHTSTHGVSLVQIRMQVWNVLDAARWKCRTQISPKIIHLGTIAQLYRPISSQLRHVSTIGKNLLNSNVSPTCPHNMVNLIRPTSGWDPLASLRYPCKFPRVSRLGSVTARHCGVEQRAPPIFGRVAITLGICPHSSSFFFLA